MQAWSSGVQYAFAGTDIEQLYQAIGNAISTVTFTAYQGSFASATVKPTTLVSFDGNDVALSTTGLEQFCHGPGDSSFKIRADFFGAADARVTLSRPNARMCPGPPWRP